MIDQNVYRQKMLHNAMRDACSNIEDHVVERYCEKVVRSLDASCLCIGDRKVAMIQIVEKLQMKPEWAADLCSDKLPELFENWMRNRAFLSTAELKKVHRTKRRYERQWLQRNTKKQRISSKGAVKRNCPNPQCTSTRAILFSKQTRSLDEPSTPYAKCVECELQWQSS